jgi:CspA family cold shock protein
MQDNRINDSVSTPIKKQGRMKWFDQRAGYGFLVPDDGDGDVFLHASACAKSDCVPPREGDYVEVIAAKWPKGWHAIRVLSVRKESNEATEASP